MDTSANDFDSLDHDDLLMSIARRKYVDHIGTVELMKQAHSSEEQEAVCIVALLDVDDQCAEEETKRYRRDRCSILLAMRKRLQAVLPALVKIA